MAQVLIGIRFSFVMLFFQNCEKLWLANGKTEELEICATKRSH